MESIEMEKCRLHRTHEPPDDGHRGDQRPDREVTPDHHVKSDEQCADARDAGQQLRQVVHVQIESLGTVVMVRRM